MNFLSSVDLNFNSSVEWYFVIPSNNWSTDLSVCDKISNNLSPAYNPESNPGNLSRKYTCPDNSPPKGKSSSLTLALVYELPVR